MAIQADFTLLIDRKKPLAEESGTGHNRWHPDLEPIARVESGAVCRLGVRDGGDCYFDRNSTVEDMKTWNLGVAHPMTGPIYVEGAEPGDLLEVEILDVEPADFGWTGIFPGFGFLSDLFPTHFLATWDLEGGVARSKEIPGVVLRGEPFMGNFGVAPSHEMMERYKAWEEECRARGGVVADDSPEVAYPPMAARGIRTIPPREVGGNMDNLQHRPGSRTLFPVQVEGALFSAGDLHFAQGDGETCGTGIEMCGVVTVRLTVQKDPAWKPRFPAYYTAERIERPAFATSGLSVTADGSYEAMDLNLATRTACLEMIDYLKTTRAYTAEQAYVIISVAVDLRLSQVVDIPSPIVSAFLPLDIFE